MSEQNANYVRRLNAVLHALLGTMNVCEHGCTHVVFGEWTALGVANVLARHRAHIDGSGVISEAETG